MRQSRGFTLIEALVALLLLAIVLLGLAAGLLAAMRHNILNHLRDGAKNLAMECAENVRNSLNLAAGSVACNGGGAVEVDSPCTDLTKSTPELVKRKIRNFVASYRLGWDVKDGGDVYEVRITVCWSHGGKDYSHSITTLIPRGGIP